MKPGNILLIWDRMGDYHRARWQELRRHLPGVDVYAADLGGSDHLYSWNTTTGDPFYRQLSPRPASSFDIRRIFRFIQLLKSSHITTICVAGYGRPEYIFFLLWGKLTGRRVMMFAESWYPSSAPFDKVKSFLIRACCDGILASGNRAQKHFVARLQIPAHKVKIGYSVVDNEHFRAQATSRSKILLCIARFAEEKNLLLLISAFNESRLASEGWHLRIVGGGPLHQQLEQIASGKPVSLWPWQAYDQLPKVYAEASAFILPSTFEPWGLVVNEAMAAGLPLILSNEVGCVPDLLSDGHNGWVFPSNSKDELITVLDRLSVTPPDKLREMGEASRGIVAGYSTVLFASNLKALILGDDAE